MAWEHLSVTKPHLVYIILGGFTSLFMLCSSVIKERLYIGEATVATLCGIIFGPHAADLINPMSWGNEDLITLEFSRIVLVVQCFAVGVELPKAYMERHWKSVTFLLVPVMTFGWLITSLFIWWMVPTLTWLGSLACAACVTATDPVLASSVVGKGKFAKRVPKHLRDLLSAESGCNDGMAFPFIYLAIYLIRYRPDADKVAFHWFCYTVLYECIFGAFYGVCVGYIARRAIRLAHERDLIDRESFLVFYFVLALFCAGSGSMLGMDDLLIGFAAGVGFSNDGWFTEKTEEAHVSNVIDLLINLAFFVYFGTIIPWEQFNAFDTLGLSPWRLVVIAVLVIFFRRIPIMLALKPIIPDLKTWREALFAGHFGPIGVGAIFVAILARAELETEETTPLAHLPEPGFEHLNIIEVIWPLTTFLVIASIVVHGSSIAVFTLGKHINTLTLTLSYTKDPEEGPSWMERLPRIQSRSKSSMSLSRRPSDALSEDEKLPFSPGTLGPVGFPGAFLRRQKEEEGGSRASSVRPSARRRKWDQGLGPGGPISQSAIMPSKRPDDAETPMEKSGSETLAMDEGSGSSSPAKHHAREAQQEVYVEGHNVVIEDTEGNVLEVRPLDEVAGNDQHEQDENIKKEGRKLMKEKDVEHGVSQTEEPTEVPARVVEGPKAAQEAKEAVEKHGLHWRDMRQRMQSLGGSSKRPDGEAAAAKPEPKRGPALAYQFGNTIIVEDEDGEVIKKYDIPGTKRPAGERRGSLSGGHAAMQRLRDMGSYFGRPHDATTAGPSGEAPSDSDRNKPAADGADGVDDGIRFTVGASGRRLSKTEFINQVRQLDPKSRAEALSQSQAPAAVKREIKRTSAVPELPEEPAANVQQPEASYQPRAANDSAEDVPVHDVHSSLARFSMGGDGPETAAQRRRRLAAEQSPSARDDSASPGRVPARAPAQSKASPSGGRPVHHSKLEEGETAAERRRREGALGMTRDDSESEEEDEAVPGTRKLPTHRGRIQFADQPATSATGSSRQQEASASNRSSGGRLRWGDDVRTGKK